MLVCRGWLRFRVVVWIFLVRLVVNPSGPGPSQTLADRRVQVVPDPIPGPDIPEEWIQELAASGAICEKCGGVHLVSMDQLVHALSSKKFSGVEVPWCSCPACPACGPWRDQAEATAQRLVSERPGETAR